MSITNITNKLTVTRNQSNYLPLITAIVFEETLTERETEIVTLLIRMKYKQMTQDIRTLITSQLGISRANLNNILIRMQNKNVFSKDWQLSQDIAQLMNPISQIILKLS